jgi:hypothetical protein
MKQYVAGPEWGFVSLTRFLDRVAVVKTFSFIFGLMVWNTIYFSYKCLVLKNKIEFIFNVFIRYQHFASHLDAVSGRVAHPWRRRQRGALADRGEVEQDF